MKKGQKATLIIPPDLAYGSEGFGYDIPPHSTLIFDVEEVYWHKTTNYLYWVNVLIFSAMLCPLALVGLFNLFAYVSHTVGYKT